MEARVPPRALLPDNPNGRDGTRPSTNPTSESDRHYLYCALVSAACVNLATAYAHLEDDSMKQPADASRLPGYATTVEELKTYGSFRRVKQQLSTQIGFRLHARSWNALVSVMRLVRQALTQRRGAIDTVLKGKSIHAIRSELRQLLGIDLPGQTIDSLRQQVEQLTSTFCQEPQSPAERYEEIKKRNFINSSRLEGLEIDDVSGQSLEQILAEYREAG